MAEIIKLAAVVSERNASVEAAWQRFVEADKRAKETLAFDDGLVARRAYREFLELFDVRRK